MRVWCNPKYVRFQGELKGRSWALDGQTQAVTRDMLHDDGCGGQARILASSVRLMVWSYGLDRWVDAQ